jgi:isoleucyl-tRNA synthetase
VSHGFVLDKKGEKMSKSKGNVIDPLKIISEKGAEVLRLSIANSDFFNDINISDEIIKQNVEVYRKIRGTIRYMLGNISDFDVTKNKPSNMNELHLLILEKLNQLSFDVINNYENYAFLRIIKDVNAFLIFLSTFYFEIARDVLYTDHVDSKERRSFQYVIYQITNVILKALAPILPVTMDEAYENFSDLDKQKSIHLTSFITATKPSYDLSKK